MLIRKASFLIPVAIASLSLALHARAQDATAQATSQITDETTPQTTSQATAHPITPEELALMDRYLTTVRTQPVGKVDTRTAAAGQGITLQVTQDATLANGTALPRGTRLIGRILRAKAYEKDNSAAILSIDIDRAVFKDGSSVRIRCVLRAITSTGGPRVNPPDASQGGSRSSRLGNSSLGDPLGGTIPLGDATPMGGDPIGADSSGMGGIAGADSSGNGSVYGNSGGARKGAGTVPTPGPAGLPSGDPGIGSSSNRLPLPNTTAIAAAPDPEQPVTTAGERIHEVPHRTGMPGVMLSGSSAVGVSGTLTAFDRNITLDSNATITFGVIVTGK